VAAQQLHAARHATIFWREIRQAERVNPSAVKSKRENPSRNRCENNKKAVKVQSIWEMAMLFIYFCLPLSPIYVLIFPLFLFLFFLSPHSPSLFRSLLYLSLSLSLAGLLFAHGFDLLIVFAGLGKFLKGLQHFCENLFSRGCSAELMVQKTLP
jgi:hypothetical protein